MYFDLTKEGWLDQLDEVLTIRDRLYISRLDLPVVKEVLEENGEKYMFHIMDPSAIYVGEKRPYGLDIMRAVFIDIKEDILKEIAPYDARKTIYIQDGYDQFRDRVISRYPSRVVGHYGKKDIEESPELKDRERFSGTSPSFQEFVIEKLEKPMGMTFRPHQIKVAYAMVRGDPNIKGLIAAHEVGTGKTLTSLLSAICTRELRPDLKIDTIEVAVKPVIENQWQGEIKKFPLEYQKNIVTYKVDSLYNELKVGKKPTALSVEQSLGVYCKNKFLIIDEAHELRTELPSSFKTGDTSVFMPKNLAEYILAPKAKAKKAMMYIACAHLAPKILLLSGTIVVNKPSDVVNLFNMILPPIQPISDGEIDRAFEEGKDAVDIANKLKKKLNGLISVVNKDTAYYPSTIQENQWIDMTPKYLDAYLQIERDERERLNIPKGRMASGAFFSNVRQASNVIEKYSPKIESCIELIKKHTSVDDPLRRVLVYSPYKEYGIETVGRNLDLIGVDYRRITGDESRDRKEMDLTKTWYNEDDLSKPKVLLISEAGSVGLDLKRTSAVILLQPNWNEAKDEQIIGRAVRSGSHADVPEKDRVVRVYHLFLKKPYEEVKEEGINKLFLVDKKLQEEADAELASILSKEGGTVPLIPDKTASADFRLYEITQEKAQQGTQFMEVLRVLSI